MPPKNRYLPALMMIVVLMPCALTGRAASPGDLFQAARRGDERAIERVTQAGVHINTHDAQGRTAMHYAAENGHTRMIASLRRKGLSLSDQDQNGQTPLHLAAKFGQNEAADYLVQLGAPSTTPDNEGKTPLDLAIENGHSATRDAMLHPGKYYKGDRSEREKTASSHRATSSRSRTVHRSQGMSWAGMIFLPLPFVLVLGAVFMFGVVQRRHHKRMSGRRGAPATDEAAILRRIWEGLDRMERRADNLETILLRPEDGPTRG